MTTYQKIKQGVDYCSTGLSTVWQNPLLSLYFGIPAILKTAIELVVYNFYHTQLHFKSSLYLQSILINTLEHYPWIYSLISPFINLMTILISIVAGFFLTSHTIPLMYKNKFSYQELLKRLYKKRLLLLKWSSLAFCALCALAIGHSLLKFINNTFLEIIILVALLLTGACWKLMTTFVIQIITQEQLSIIVVLQKSLTMLRNYFFQYCGIFFSIGLITALSIAPMLILEKLIMPSSGVTIIVIGTYGLTICLSSLITTIFIVTKTILYLEYQKTQSNKVYDNVPVPPL
jgi:hypothetical protein